MPNPLVVITGASSGIGRSVARAFAGERHPLLLISRNIAPLPELPADDVLYERADVADYAAVESAIRKAEARYGGVECLVNSAGLADARYFTKVGEQDYAREIDVNLKGTLNCIHVVLKGMIERKSGTVINIGSVSDRKTGPAAVAYTATKYGVRALTESLREFAATAGVRFINVAPGYVKTNIHAGMGITFEEYCNLLGNPDFMSPDELAEIIFFCWKQPKSICVREIVVAPTRTSF